MQGASGERLAPFLCRFKSIYIAKNGYNKYFKKYIIAKNGYAHSQKWLCHLKYYLK